MKRRMKYRKAHPSIIAPAFAIALTALLLSGCGDKTLPLDALRAQLGKAATYTITLENMKEDGNFFKDYFHQYQVGTPGKTWATGWMAVPEKFYRTYQPLLGMVVAGRKDGEPVQAAAPPGYMFVGDQRYGAWRSDTLGREYWAFNRNTPLFDEIELDNDFPPIYRGDYRNYSSYRSRGVPYFGSGKQFGTQGAYTKKSKPTFFERRTAKASVSKASFTDKVKRSVGRGRTDFRSRAGGRGK